MSGGPLGQQNLWRNVFIPAASKARSSSWAWQPKRTFIPRSNTTKKSGRSWAALMNPDELRDRVTEAIESHISVDLIRAKLLEENAARESLDQIAKGYAS